MVLVFTSKITNRVHYAFKLIFWEILGLPFKITTTEKEFLDYKGPKFNYSNHHFGDELYMSARPLLFETGITDQNISIFEIEHFHKAFFPAGRTSFLPFDIFAASFYLVSRYEEYLPHIRDQYDRFDPHESLAFKNDFLHKPLVNIWAIQFGEILKEKFPSVLFPEKKYSFVSTFDIDNAFAYLEKGLMRTIGGFGKSLLKLDFTEILERAMVLLDLRKDPFDTYQYQLQFLQKHQIKAIYFFLVGDYGVNDKNIPVQSKKFQTLIKSIADYFEVGIHPSFGSNYNPSKLKIEVERLSKILNREILRSRQHFLKLNLPETYRNLIDMDITNDYTMGYSTETGFRASMATPFQFYDLDLEIETTLKINPFCFMEGTLKYSKCIPPEEAMDHIKPLIDETKAVNGVFISLWHNDSISEIKQMKGWRKVFEETSLYALPVNSQ